MSTEIAGWGEALPSGAVDQDRAAEHAVEMWGQAAGLGTTLPALYRRSGVKRRFSVIVEPGHASGDATQSFYHTATDSQDRGPTTRQRMQRFERDALDLATQSCRSALQLADVAAADITHLVTVSCSGFEAPGVDIGLVERLGLSREVARTNVGFMGCHGAFNALRVGRAFCESDPKARVLVGCIELCSLHQQYSSDPQQIVANALFADGSAAVVLRQSAASTPGWQVVDQNSCVLEGTTDHMSWRVGDHGFQMTLSPAVPDVIRSRIPAWIDQWLARHQLSHRDVPSWAIHPGGPRILSACGEALSLSAEQLEPSRTVLAEYGNMSSPTVLFILNRLRQRAARTPCVALAFGPGLTVEAALFRASS